MDPKEPLTQEKLKTTRMPIILGGALLFLLLSGIIFYVVAIQGKGSIPEIFSFPKAGNITVDQGTQGDPRLPDIQIPGEGGDEKRMFKIADGPVSGHAFKLLSGGDLTVRYVLKENGNIYEYDLTRRSGRILANSTIPGIQEALWDARGQFVLLRSANEVERISSVLGKIVPNTATSTGDEAPAKLDLSFLARNIEFAASGPEEGFIHTLKTAGVFSLIRITQEGNKGETIFTSPFSEWIPEWPGKNTITLTTRPSARVGGYLFTLDLTTKEVRPLINDFLGLTVRGAPDGKKFLVGGSKNRGMTLGVATTQFPVPSQISPATLPEKCVWTASSTIAYCGVPESVPPGEYPDEWYQGVLQFSDTLWKLDGQTNIFTLLAIPRNEAGVQVDVLSPLVSSDGHYITFINKRDGSLWGYDLLGVKNGL